MKQGEIPRVSEAGVLGGVGAEVPGAAPMVQGRTQRELILEAVEALKALLGQAVGTRVVDLIQEHIPPPPKVTPPSSPSELERAQHLAKLLEDKLKLDKTIQVERVSKARHAVAEAEDDLSILQQEMKGLANHHREDDARRERTQGFRDQNDAVDEANSGEEVGVQAEGGKKRKVGKGRFGGGSGSARGISPAQLLELLCGMSEEDQNTFKRNMGPHGGDNVSSVEVDSPRVGVRVEDRAETPCR